MPADLATFPIGGKESGIALRVGRYGPYVEGPDDEATLRASGPTCPTTCRPTS
jgi:DNA topoisomerase-1